ncbi:MAG: GIN domain-containing protein [Candidatus Kapaibacterium sp.]
MKSLIIILTLIIAGCESQGPSPGRCLNGYGERGEKIIDVSGFEKLRVEIPSNLIISEGDHSIRVETEKNLFEFIGTELEGDSLFIGSNTAKPLCPDDMKIFISAPNLRYVRMAASGNIQSEGDINYDITEFIIDGPGNIIMSGSADSSYAVINGFGNINLRDYSTVSTFALVSGYGNIFANASDILRAYIYGNGNIMYSGGPDSTDFEIRGYGNISELD